MQEVDRRVRELSEEWGLTADGEPHRGHGSLVLPVRRGAEPAVLKLGAGEHEALALQRWRGDGAVRLLSADPHRGALLLERLEPGDLSDLWDLEACEVVAGLYRRLHVPALPQLRPYADHLGQQLRGPAPVPHRLVDQALSLLAELGDVNDRMIHSDLHYAHVLAADREPWLAIDPQPMAGDPHAEPAPMLWNRWDEITGDVRAGVRRRFHTLVDAAGLDEDRARDWVVVRAVAHAYEVRSDHDRLTAAISVAKAVQD